MTFFSQAVGLVELLILYARVQFYRPRASDYRLISKTVQVSEKNMKKASTVDVFNILINVTLDFYI